MLSLLYFKQRFGRYLQISVAFMLSRPPICIWQKSFNNLHRNAYVTTEIKAFHCWNENNKLIRLFFIPQGILNGYKCSFKSIFAARRKKYMDDEWKEVEKQNDSKTAANQRSESNHCSIPDNRFDICSMLDPKGCRQYMDIVTGQKFGPSRPRDCIYVADFHDTGSRSCRLWLLQDRYA